MLHYKNYKHQSSIWATQKGVTLLRG